MWLSLLPYTISGTPVYVIVKAGWWFGVVKFVWFDHLVLSAHNTPGVLIPYDTVVEIKSDSVNNAVHLLNKIFEREEEPGCGHP